MNAPSHPSPRLASTLRLCSSALVAAGMLALALPAALAAKPAPVPVTGEMTVLPPFIVEGKTEPLHWRYLAAPGFEVISVCDDQVTRAFVERCFRLEQLLAAVLPKQYQAVSAVPEKLILFDEKITRARSHEVMEEMMRRSGGKMPEAQENSVLPWEFSGPSSPWPKRPPPRILPNLRLRDADTTVVFVSLANSRTSAMDFTYQADRIADWLESRAPALPGWLIEGMLGLYQQTALQSDQVQFGPASWISESETTALRAEPDRPRTLLPMQELLANPWHGKHASDEDLTQVWRAQCALFVRWAIAENNEARTVALWKLVDRLASEPLTEKLFQECFGLGFSDVRDRLSDYLPTAVARTRILSVDHLVPPPALDVRDAAPVEVARICGEWERLEIKYIKGNIPHLTEKYIEQARHRMAGLYDGGNRDPDFVTVRALIEVDAGNASEARANLESAVAAGVIRPRAYLELALLRYQEILAEAGDGKFRPEQTRRILEPVWIGCKMEPALPDFFALMATVWGKSEVPPTPDELARLAAGLRRFPKLSPLTLQGIVFHVQAGLTAPAIELAHLGWLHAQEPKARTAFERILVELNASSGFPEKAP